MPQAERRRERPALRGAGGLNAAELLTPTRIAVLAPGRFSITTGTLQSLPMRWAKYRCRSARRPETARRS
jgi:hypothetical protein